jgi:hypothetical protein
MLCQQCTGTAESYGSSYAEPAMESYSENGFVLNGLIGGEYKLGSPSLFAEAGIAYPANQVGNSYVENVIPAHFTVNIGVKFSLGGGSSY